MKTLREKYEIEYSHFRVEIWTRDLVNTQQKRTAQSTVNIDWTEIASLHKSETIIME